MINVIALVLDEIYQKSTSEEQKIEDFDWTNIVPILKKGMKSKTLNYWPTDRIIIAKVEDHLNATGLITDTRYGYTRSRSLHMNLQKYTYSFMNCAMCD